MDDKFEKIKIINYIKRLMLRRELLTLQLNNDDSEELRQITLGELKQCDLVIKEMMNEFDINEDEF